MRRSSRECLSKPDRSRSRCNENWADSRDSIICGRLNYVGRMVGGLRALSSLAGM